MCTHSCVERRLAERKFADWKLNNRRITLTAKLMNGRKKMKMTTTEKEIIFEWKKTTKKKVHKSIGAMRYGWISSSNDETAHERCEKFSRLLKFQVSSDAKVVSYFKNVVVVAHVSLVDTQLLSHCIVMTKREKERAKERALKTSK